MSDFRLKVFQAVANHLSFTKAAAELFITQPAVSKHIQELETEFDIRLFERKGNKIVLSSAGQILLKYSNQISSIYNQIEFDLSALKKKFSGHLQLGASTTIGQYVLPPVLAEFHQSFPGIKLSLINDNTEKIEQALIEKKIELALVEGKTKNNQLKYIPFMEDELVPIVRSRHPLAKKAEITMADLKLLPVVFRERGSGSLEVIEHELNRHGISLAELNIALYLGSTESIKSYVANSDCLGFISVSAISRELSRAEFQIIDVKDLTISRMFYFIHLQGKSDNLSEHFIRFAQNSITKSNNT